MHLTHFMKNSIEIDTLPFRRQVINVMVMIYERRILLNCVGAFKN